MQSAFIAFIGAILISLCHSRCLTVNANFVVQVCFKFMRQTDTAIVAERMSIKDQGQCEATQPFKGELQAIKVFFFSISCFYKMEKNLLKICNNCNKDLEKQV